MIEGDPGEVEYGLVMPFIVCASKGGPYNDDAYVAGWEAGGLDMALELSPLRPGTIMRLPQAFHAGNRSQIDLIAMKHGVTAEFEDAADEWVYLILSNRT